MTSTLYGNQRCQRKSDWNFSLLFTLLCGDKGKYSRQVIVSAEELRGIEGCLY